MPEPFDVYADTFRVRISPWGSNLTFDLHAAQPGIEDAHGEFAETGRDWHRQDEQ